MNTSSALDVATVDIAFHRRFKVGHLITHPVQYLAPLYRHLSRNPSIDLTVFFLSDFSLRSYHDPGFGVSVEWDVPLLGGYSHVFVPSIGGGDRVSFSRPWTHGFANLLKRRKCEALWVAGWSSIPVLRGILSAKRLGVKVLVCGDSHAGGPNPPSVWKLQAKRILFPRFFRLIDGFLALSRSNRDYYLQYGVPAERVFLVPYCVDNVFFQQECQKAAASREELRRALNLEPGRPVILYASKLIERKRPIDLIDAYAELSRNGKSEPKPYLLFVGEGEQAPTLREHASTLGWDSIRFLGFKNQRELPRYYDLCDVFVLVAQYEGLATVIPEVMNAGKPVIITPAVGLGQDLVINGENGFIVPACNPTVLADKLRLITEKPELAAEMGRKSLQQVSCWNFEAHEKGLLEALEAIVPSKDPW
jgi:glycosyltransferase involved in cell wall biosynthesis